MAKEFYVTTEIFYVAIGFHRVVLRQSVLCCDPVGQGNETSCRDIRVLCRDRVWPGQEFSITKECFYVVTELTMVERLYLAKEYFMLRQSVAK